MSVENQVNVYQHAEIVMGCQRNERRAQAELYSLYSRAMYNICLRIVGSAESAEDVLQNSFIDIFSKIDSFRFEATIGAWIKRIVVNNCINHLKKRRLVFAELNESYGQHIADRSDTETPIFNVEKINRAIYQLPEGYRIVFSLYALEGYDHEEIGQILGITEATSKSQYSRAKAKLRDILGSPQQLMQ
jgi:RNA polymerase sigma factor (sigma-70 family)